EAQTDYRTLYGPLVTRNHLPRTAGVSRAGNDVWLDPGHGAARRAVLVWALLSRRSALCSPTRLPYAGRTNPVGRQTGRDLLRCADRRAALGVERVDFCHVWAPGGLFTITELIEEYLALCACPCRMIDINRQKSSLESVLKVSVSRPTTAASDGY